MKKYICWSLAAVCYMLAAVSVLVPVSNYGLSVALRVGALPVLVAALLLTSAALSEGHKPAAGVGIHTQEQPVGTGVEFPAHLTLEQKSEGSLRGAVKALEQMQTVFAANPMAAWQLRRILTACTALRQLLDNDSAQARNMADFTVQYLPVAMQYLMGCCHRLPTNGVEAMARIACACERQQDALAQGLYVTFEQEHQQLQQDLLAGRQEQLYL